MSVTFYYVRHGETLFNQIRRMQGACDSPLTKEGIQQAEDTAGALCRIRFDHIFCSSSERAWDTAKIIQQKQNGVEPICLKELKEFDFGELDGERIDRFQSLIQPHRMRDDWTDMGGENVEIFARRAQAAFDKILSVCEDGETVLIVSHGSYLMHLMKTHFQYDQQEYIARMHKADRPFVPNCSISIFNYENGVYTLLQEPLKADEFRMTCPKQLTFYFVRHGETVFNVQKRMQGWCDAPLTEKGKADVLKTADKISDIQWNAAYCSTSERARDTAAILLRNKEISVISDKRLREVFFGEWEGAHYEEHYKELMKPFNAGDWTPFGGEDQTAIRKRLLSFFGDVTDRANDGDHILLVSHGMLYMTMLEVLFGIDRQAYYERAEKEGFNPTPNGGICIFTYKNGTYEMRKLMADE